MDISDQHIQQLAASSHGASHGFLPLGYMHNLQTVDNYSSHMPNHTSMQPPLIINSSNMNDLSNINKASPAALIHCNSNAAAGSTMSPSYFMFNPGNMNMGSINSGLEQIPGSYKTTFDFNQIYDDPAHIFNIAGVDPHENMQSTDLNHEQKLRPADPDSATKSSRSGDTSIMFISQVSQSACADCPSADSTHTIVKLEPGMDHYAPPSSFTSSGYPSATAAASFLDSLHVDLESLKEEAYIDQRIGTFDHDTVASTSSSADHHHHHSHFFDFCNLPSISARDKSPSLIGSHGYSLHGITENNTHSSHSKASCSHASAVESSINTATRCKTQVVPKRRKSQQKRVICVPATGGLDRPTGECLPSDSWAWRKYGQKPIKNSKYPRSYYKCSSVKGCTARKQVERNPLDPTMIMITYIVDHSHPSADQQQQLAKTDEEEQCNNGNNNKHINGNMISGGDGNDAVSEESYEPISSEGNYPEENLMVESAHHHEDDHYATDTAEQFAGDQSDDQACDQQGGPSIVQGNIENSYMNNEGIHDVGLISSSSSNYFGNLKKSSSDQRNKADQEDFFNQLDELPGLFGRNPGWPTDASDQAGAININPINLDFFELYDWS